MEETTNKLTIRAIAEMTDAEVYGLSRPRPNRPAGVGESRGFMFSLENFKSPDEMSECLYVLMMRLGKIGKVNK